MIAVRQPTLQLPYDLARWAFETTMREGLPPDEPEVLRAVAGTTWRIERGLSPARATLMLDEVRRLFRVSVRTAESAVREGYDLTMQSRLEALLLPRMAPATVGQWARVVGHLPRPSVVVAPHAGHLLLLATALGIQLAGGAEGSPTFPLVAPRGLVVYGARGLPPRRRRAIGAIRDTWINRHVAQRRLDERDRLPILWEPDASALHDRLLDGYVVLAAFDDRAWPTYERIELNGREALLSPDPWRIARAAGVPVIPATIRREHDKSHLVRLGTPIEPSLSAYLEREAWPFLEGNPGHYAMWLAECRMRAAMDDHPLFVDYAPDTRWMRWREAAPPPR